MTTETNTFEVRQPLRGLNWRRLLAIGAVSVVSIFVLAAVIAFAYASMNSGRVLPGVTIGEVAVSGLEPAEVEQLLRAELPDVGAGSLQLHIGGIDHEVPYSEIGRDYDMDTMLNQAMGVGRAGNPLDQLANQLRGMFGTVELAPIVVFNTELLTSRVGVHRTRRAGHTDQRVDHFRERRVRRDAGHGWPVGQCRRGRRPGPCRR